MRLLVLDGSRVLHTLVRRLAPSGVDVEEALTFHEAEQTLRERPPDAVIVNLTPAELPWAELKRLCQTHTPPIPVLYESCIHQCPSEAGLGELHPTGEFLTKPYSVSELRRQIDRLVHLARQGVEQPETETRARQPATSVSRA